MKTLLAVIVSILLFTLSNFDFDLGLLPILMFVIAPYLINYLIFSVKRISLSFLIYSATSFVLLLFVLVTKMFALETPSFYLEIINDYMLIFVLLPLSLIFLTFSLIAASREYKRVSAAVFGENFRQ